MSEFGQDYEHKHVKLQNDAARVPSAGLLELRIGPGLVSRVCEMAGIIEIEAGDFRREVKMQRHAY